MENTEFENQRYYRMLPDRLNQLIADVTDLENLYKSKKDSATVEYISFLQFECPEIETKLNKVLTYLKTTHLKDEAKQRFLRYSKRLNVLLFEFEDELKRLNSSRNIELENAFDFELDNDYTIESNKLLPNYLEIEKEFKDFIKIEEIPIGKNEYLNNSYRVNKVVIQQHTDIFSNNGFELFSYILENHIQPKGKSGRYADLSYYYWEMYNSKPKYIHQRPESFKNWFCINYTDSFNKIKAIHEVTDKKGNRTKDYKSSLDWFNTQV